MQQTKATILRAHLAAGPWDKALALAAKFQRLGDDGGAITRAHAAIINPAFYRQLNRDPAGYAPPALRP